MTSPVTPPGHAPLLGHRLEVPGVPVGEAGAQLQGLSVLLFQGSGPQVRPDISPAVLGLSQSWGVLLPTGICGPAEAGEPSGVCRALSRCGRSGSRCTLCDGTTSFILGGKMLLFGPEACERED